MASEKLVVPLVEQRYDCHSCGHCCRNYTVPVTAEDRERITSQGWEDENDFDGIPLFVMDSAAQDYVLNQKDDGSCVFLSAQGRCRIHERFGGHTKPLGCRMYPYVFNRVGNQIHVSLRFDCPSVAGNLGTPLASQKKALIALGREVVESRDPPPLTFRGSKSITDKHLIETAMQLEKIISNTAIDLTRRVLAVVKISAMLDRCNLRKVEDIGKMREFLELAAKVAVAEASVLTYERKAPGRLIAMFFRQSLALYGRRDRPALSVTQRLRQALTTLRGKGSVPAWQLGLPDVSFRSVETSYATIDLRSEELLSRNLRNKLAGMSFFGPTYFNFSFLEGLRSLLLMYPVTLWFARLFALDQGEEAISESSVEKALHIVEGPYGRRPVFRLPAERWRTEVLTRPENLTKLVVWYGTAVREVSGIERTEGKEGKERDGRERKGRKGKEREGTADER